MTIIMTTESTTLAATTVKRRFLELLKQLRTDNPVITVTRNGTPAGVLMSVEEYDALIETIEVLSDRKALRSIERNRRELDSGHKLTHADVWGDE